MENDASDIVLNPAQVLRQINLELIRTQTGKHATMFYGVIDTEDNVLDYASAAHFPAPVLCINGACQGIEPESLAVGLFDDAVFENRRQKLDGFERLSVVSDGFLELLDDVSLQEKERHLLELGGDPTHTMEQVLTQMTSEGRTRSASDDITVLIIERVN